ncbi:GNAT family N-acetyltransferase [Actinomadura violacea]|uniref:GNAT family N-acetyltransferase n=1 Tax=Actinomadura violacea TaxID=2819934 RepID=A0ABS3RH99_9ACTN|nr:GNAT family N-acetyltransferase [Actinomadura violacea]MBO2456106.1 GNAT family N-acetyltransferase [Actinomadura violacea]
MPPAIRTATETDAPAIAHLHLASYRAAYRGLLPDDFLSGLDPAQREHRWLESLRDPSRATFVAESGTALTGFAEIAFSGELKALHIAETHWRQGTGTALHSRAVHTLKAAGLKSAVLWVLQGNQRACAFYETAGWTFTGETRHRTIRGTAVDELRYRIRWP